MKYKQIFKTLWKNSGYTITEIARRTGISRDILYKMGHNPYYNLSLDTVSKLCKFFNCVPNDLIVVDTDGYNPSKTHDKDNPLLNKTSVEKTTTIKVDSLESIVEYVKRLPPEEREAVEGIYESVLETVIMVMEK